MFCCLSVWTVSLPTELNLRVEVGFSFENGPFFTRRKKVLEPTWTQKAEDWDTGRTKRLMELGTLSWQWLSVGPRFPGGEIKGDPAPQHEAWPGT